MVRDLALQQPGAVHLYVCLESLLRGPARGPAPGFFFMAGRAAGDQADLGRESGFCGKGERDLGVYQAEA